MSSPIQIEQLPLDKITIFDIKCNDRTPNTVSPWGRVVINAARVKHIPFHLELIEWIDTPALFRMLGTTPAKNIDSFYTLPAIFDPKTKTSLADSLCIVQYFDNQFPDSPRLVPPEGAGLVAGFLATCKPIDETAFCIILPKMLQLLEGTRSENHFRNSRMKAIGTMNIEEITPTGQEAVKIWSRMKSLFNDVDCWYVGHNQFVMEGDHPTYVDLAMAGRLWWYRSSLGPESHEWLDLASWNDGRWGKLIAYFDTYYPV